MKYIGYSIAVKYSMLVLSNIMEYLIPYVRCCICTVYWVLSYTYCEYQLDTGNFSLCLLSLMLRYYQFKNEYILYPCCFSTNQIKMTNFIAQ